MKRISLILVAILSFTNVMAQTDARNQQKYWKVRNSFRQDYIRVGTEAGESLPMGGRRWGLV